MNKKITFELNSENKIKIVQTPEEGKQKEVIIIDDSLKGPDVFKLLDVHTGDKYTVGDNNFDKTEQAQTYNRVKCLIELFNSITGKINSYVYGDEIKITTETVDNKINDNLLETKDK